MKKMIALFPGSFDPYTIGHYSIVERALPLFDKIVIAVGVNRNKQSLMSEEKRVEAIRSLYENNEKIEVISYNLAEVNRNISGLETILLYTLPEYGHISSSIVRELASYGKDVTDLLPPGMKIPKKHE